MNARQNSLIVKKLFDEVYTKGRLSYLEEAFSSDVDYFDSIAPNTRGGFKELLEKEQEYLSAFPVKFARIDDLLEVGQNIIARWTFSGRHDGWLHDFAPTNRTFKITGISIYTFEKGKIAEVHESWDRLGLLEQIGVFAPAEALHA